MNLTRTFNKKGFATITLLLFLPLFCLVVFSFAFIGYVIQYKTKMRSLCLKDSVALENAITNHEENLFKLNPLAQALRTQLQWAYVRLALAVAAEDGVSIAAITFEITQIKARQEQLDLAQRTLIQLANLDIQRQLFLLDFKLQQSLSDTQSIWHFYIESFTVIRRTHTPNLSVRPDSPDVAPVYELTPDYIDAQHVAYKWQHLFKTKKTGQVFIAQESILEMSCSASAKKEGGTWSTQISVDKF